MNSAGIWLIAGCVLMILELCVPGFIIFFFGAGAIVTALALTISPIGPTSQVLVFLLSALVMLFLFRRFMPKVFSGQQKNTEVSLDEDEYAGETAIVAETISPEKAGKIYFHGSVWNAESARLCNAGEQVRIIRRQNLTYIVK